MPASPTSLLPASRIPAASLAVLGRSRAQRRDDRRDVTRARRTRTTTATQPAVATLAPGGRAASEDGCR